MSYIFRVHTGLGIKPLKNFFLSWINIVTTESNHRNTQCFCKMCIQVVMIPETIKFIGCQSLNTMNQWIHGKLRKNNNKRKLCLICLFAFQDFSGDWHLLLLFIIIHFVVLSNYAPYCKRKINYFEVAMKHRYMYVYFMLINRAHYHCIFRNVKFLLTAIKIITSVSNIHMTSLAWLVFLGTKCNKIRYQKHCFR